MLALETPISWLLCRRRQTVSRLHLPRSRSEFALRQGDLGTRVAEVCCKMGIPSASTRAWILVVNPPRERAMQRDRWSFFGCWRRADARGSRTSRSSADRHHRLLKPQPKADPIRQPSAIG